MNWDRWLEEVLGKADDGPKLSVRARPVQERKIRPRPEEGETPTAAPKTRLTVPAKSGKAPPGGGWKRTPSGWARGDGDAYEWKPMDWHRQ
jgi:hypothetical protein